MRRPGKYAVFIDLEPDVHGVKPSRPVAIFDTYLEARRYARKTYYSDDRDVIGTEVVRRTWTVSGWHDQGKTVCYFRLDD